MLGPKNTRVVRTSTVAAFCIALAGAAEAGSGQSLLERTPNLTSTWVGIPSTGYVDFLHRFRRGDPTTGTENSPSILVGYGIGGYGLLGAHFNRGSSLVPGHDDEWEFLARFSPFTIEMGSSFELGLTAAYNSAAESFDSEIGLAFPIGPLKVMGVSRSFASAFGTSTRLT